MHYSFAHELIRQTLLSGMSLLRRQRVHLSVANAIEQTDPTAPATRPSEIAQHLLLAGAGADTERTLNYLERAADRDMEAAAFEEALRAIDDALSLVDGEDGGRRAKLLEHKGWAVRALGHFEECLAIWEEVLPIYHQLGDVDTAAGLCWEMGYQLIWLDRFADAFTIYARGIELLGDQVSSTRAILVGATAALLGLTGLFDQAEAQFAEATEIAQAFADERALGRIEWGRTMSNWSNPHLTDAIESGRASIEHLRCAHDVWTLVDALAWTSFPLSYGGFPGEGRRLAEEAVELGMKLGHQGGEILGRRGVASAAILEGGDLEEYERQARHDLERCENIRSPWVSQSHAWIASVLILRGDLQESLRHAEEAINLEPDSAWTGIGWSYKFLNRAMAGENETCQMLLSEQRRLLPQAGAPTTAGQMTMLCAAAQGCAIVGLARDAERALPARGRTRRHAPRRPLRPLPRAADRGHGSRRRKPLGPSPGALRAGNTSIQ